MTIGNLVFRLFLYLTGIHFQGNLQHVGDISEQKLSADQSAREK